MRLTNLLELMESRREYMRIDIKTPMEQVSVNVWDELQIDEHDLDTEFMIIAGQIAYWTAVTARFTQVVEAVRRDFDNWYAPLYDQEFNKLEEVTGRRPNISSAEYLVKITYKDEYNRRRDNLEQAETDLKVLQGVVPALNVKLQALMQLAKSRLAEFNSTDVAFKGGEMPFSKPPPVASTSRRPENTNIAEARNVLSNMIIKDDIPF